HRRARRLVDVVLVSADRWSTNLRLLPAGPWREPIHGIGRATLVVITRKAATDDQVGAASGALAQIAPGLPQATIRLAPDTLRQLGDASTSELPIGAIAGRRVHLVAAIGDPRALARQLEAAGAIVQADFFRDHHPFSDSELTAIRRRIASDSLVVCTLKDAVKMGNRWPREAPPLWYVSQRVIVERGGSAIEHGLDDLLRARHQTAPTAG
ncbi:MAG TPA: tetraacyldisaccharide 4'-kinase, partial [Gemmatimonadaceae bacterium]|nr:tetraacyldisaccharide 4'-kinase [Gemmatimonadaceae bacterium]